METKEIEIKNLPHSVSKKQLFSMYIASGLTERVVRRAINTIIAANPSRALPADKPIQVQYVWHSELMEFVEIYGLPKGYKLKDHA